MARQKNIFHLLTIVTLLVFPTGLLFAIDFPTKPVNLVVGFNPGGSMDLTTRPLAEKMSKELGVPVIVLNKPGSASLLAAEYVARSKPDGYNILVHAVTLHSRATYDTTLHIDVFKEFEPISLFSSQTIFLAVKADSKFKTIDDLIDFASKNPGKLSYGTPGIGSLGYFCMEVFRADMKLNFKHVPFTGDAPAVTALMGEHIDFMPLAWGVLFGKVTSGEMRAILSFYETRLPETREVPTLKERGFPDSVIYTWFSLVAPKGTPKEIVAKLDKATRAATEDPLTAETLRKMGYFVTYKGPEDLAKFLKAEFDKYSKLSKEKGITIK